MMRPMISVIAVVVLMVVATTMLWSRSAPIELATAAMPPLQELHAMAGGAGDRGSIAGLSDAREAIMVLPVDA